MLLGLYGPSAVGKTYFLKSVQEELPGLCIDKKLVVVYGDSGDEFVYDEEHDILKHVKNRLKWCGKRHEKVPYLPWMIGNRDVLWVADCMRYFNGLWPEIIEAYKCFHGGIRMLVPYYTGEVGKIFRQQRCDKNGKELHDFWTSEHCWAESAMRKGMCENHLEPEGIPCAYFDVGKERDFSFVKDILYMWVLDPMRKWYEKASHSD